MNAGIMRGYEELFLWAMDTAWEYPALNELAEEKIQGASFLFLPGGYGVYKGLYLCFEESSAIYDLRRMGYAVGRIDSYETAKELLLECAEFKKPHV